MKGVEGKSCHYEPCLSYLTSPATSLTPFNLTSHFPSLGQSPTGPTQHLRAGGGREGGLSPTDAQHMGPGWLIGACR